MAASGEGRRLSPSTGAGSLKGLLALVIGMGVLIAAGLLFVVVTLIHRALAPEREQAAMALAAPTSLPSVIPEPAGTRIAGIAAGGGDWLAVLLQGGGEPDRVVVVDPRGGGRSLGTLRLKVAAPSATP